MGSAMSLSEFKVSGMDCGDEVTAVQSALGSLPGVSEVSANLMASKVSVKHAPSVTRSTLIKTIQSAGLTVDGSLEKESYASEVVTLRRKVLIVLSGLLIAIGWLLGKFSDLPQFLVNGIYGLSIVSGGALILPKAFRSLRTVKLDMNVLMCVAVIGAAAIGEFLEGAVVVFLFSVSEFLESLSVERARQSIQTLLKLVPETALVRLGAETNERQIGEVAVGMTILVRSGERIPLDGTVLKGDSSVNQAPITGESLPVPKSPGQPVLAGSINGEGSLEVRVEKVHSDTKLSQIIRLIEDAQLQKAPTQRFVDRFSTIYTPTVFGLAILTFVLPPFFFGQEWSVSIYRSLVLLVIACPCALVISTPVSIVSGLTAMARRGILLKGGASLEAVGKLRALAVDKTGTITEGRPRVLSILPLNGKTELQVLEIAASIDAHSTHPLALAVVEAASEKGMKPRESAGYRSVTGRGAEAVIQDHIYFVGNHRFAHENAVCAPEIEKILKSIEDQAQSVVVVGHRPHLGCKGEIFGVLGIADAIRADAKQAIEALHKAGVESVIMLSGDNSTTVKVISQQVGIDEAHGDLLPDDKVLRVKGLRERFEHVGMVGDGVNDAPAMASASVGIAMGGSGTDTAIETSDMTLMQDRLLGVAEAIAMGKRTLSVIQFNTGLALLTKLIFLVLSASGRSGLWLAIAADTGTTLLVIANALRLLRPEAKGAHSRD